MNKKILAVIGVLVLAVFCCIGVAIFILIRSYDTSATLTTLEETTQDFVMMVHEEQWDDAYALTSRRLQGEFTQEEFQQIIQTEIGFALETYNRLEVCDWGIVNSNGDTVLQGSGLYYYGTGEKFRFTNAVIKEEGIWRLLNFRLLTDEEATPFGKCAL